MPTTWPSASSSGPPELPGFSGASVWITPSSVRPRCRLCRLRPSAETMPLGRSLQSRQRGRTLEGVMPDPTRRSTPATPAARCSTPRARSWASTPRCSFPTQGCASQSRRARPGTVVSEMLGTGACTTPGSASAPRGAVRARGRGERPGLPTAASAVRKVKDSSPPRDKQLWPVGDILGPHSTARPVATVSDLHRLSGGEAMGREVGAERGGPTRGGEPAAGGGRAHRRQARDAGLGRGRARNGRPRFAESGCALDYTRPCAATLVLLLLVAAHSRASHAPRGTVVGVGPCSITWRGQDRGLR